MESQLVVPDDWGLDGKVAIVTGGGAAGTGIGNGRAAAILLAKAGARVMVIDRAADPAAQTVAMIETLGGEAIACTADVTKPADCAAMVTCALDHFGRLDLLDNNVGIGSRGSVVDEDEETWRRVMQVNVETMFLAAKYAIPAMKGRRRRHCQCVIHFRPASARAHGVFHLQRGRHRADQGHGRGSRS
jgi:NAD(P)-dependent dehydrogenase (short-subunit alcohol dehydrogenase family)